TMVADDAAVESMSAAIAGMAAGSVHISMETISVSLSERLAEMHMAAGRGYVAAPVIGRPDAAAPGRRVVFAGWGPGGASARHAIVRVDGPTDLPTWRRCGGGALGQAGRQLHAGIGNRNHGRSVCAGAQGRTAR